MASSLLAASQRCGSSVLTAARPLITEFSVRNSERLVQHPAVQNFRCLHSFKQNTSKLHTGLRLSDITCRTNIPTWQLNCHQPMKVFPISQRLLHKDSNEYRGGQRRPVPKLLYIQNPMTWLANKLDFRMLRRVWDNEFNEGEFKKGSKQAVSMITGMIAENCFNNLKGLLTKSAMTRLEKDVETTWTDQQRQNIALTPEDIQLAVPRRVHFQRILEQRFCDIDMVFIGLKWVDSGPRSAVVFIEIIARFHREYTEGRLPDWTISLFKVTRFNVLPR